MEKLKDRLKNYLWNKMDGDLTRTLNDIILVAAAELNGALSASKFPKLWNQEIKRAKAYENTRDVIDGHRKTILHYLGYAPIFFLSPWPFPYSIIEKDQQLKEFFSDRNGPEEGPTGYMMFITGLVNECWKDERITHKYDFSKDFLTRLSECAEWLKIAENMAYLSEDCCESVVSVDTGLQFGIESRLESLKKKETPRNLI